MDTKSGSKTNQIKRSHRILLMDDDPFVSDFMKQLLEDLGYETACATDGLAAIKMFEKAQQDRPFAVTILDLTVRTGMGGKEAIKELLKLDPQVKAIATSGYLDDPVFITPKEYGFSGALAKPFQTRELELLLKRILEEG